MGKLVQFENKGRASAAPREGTGTAGQVLIFTGVRYERDTGPTKPTATSSGGKRKRG